MKDGYVKDILKYGSLKKATDIHFCVGSKPLIRINGLLEEIGGEVVFVDKIQEIIDSLIDDNQMKKLSEKKVLDFSFSVSGLGRFRANIYSQRGTFAIAIRMLPFDIPSMETLGLPPIVETFATKTKGLFLVTGTTGSGKSTTLASMIDLINEKYPYHVITIEDPIEYLHKHKKSLVTQREIGQDAESFAGALYSALREDPDVIMVGEMRDPETIQIALTAAETGHLVFSTLHTLGASKSIDRILDAFPAAQQPQIRTQLATVLSGIVSQQLLPRVDNGGLVVATEVMLMTSAIKNMIREGKHYQINNIIQTGESSGMHPLEMDLARLIKSGVVDYDETVLLAQDQRILEQFLNRR